ncbi:MAG TPA: hypothetical protein VGW38_13605, partial [Chloroflexota bacterium]|nr:hypothetical protein [Chloroflexota bacterium]
MEAGRPGDDQERADKAARARERFVALVRRPDEQFNLAEAALLIAAEEYPGINITDYLGKIDDLA